MANLSKQEDLAAGKISDEVKQRIITWVQTWAKWIGVAIGILGTIAGITGYRELMQSAQEEVKAQADKIAAEYRQSVTANIIAAIVEAKTSQKELEISVKQLTHLIQAA